MSALRRTPLLRVSPAWPVARPAALVALALSVAVPPAAAQPPATGASTGVIAGTVHDSLFTRAPLADAELLIEGVPLTARTDARGRYRIDGVPAGRHRVSFTHPSLDAVGLSAPVGEVDVPAGRTVTAALATPSPATVHAALCGAPPPVGTALLIGAVQAGEDPTPLPITRAQGGWDEVVLRRGGATRERPVVEGVVTTGGAFALCRVPSDAEVTVSALLDDGRAAATALRLDGAAALGVALVVGPASAVRGPSPDSLGWRGRVVGPGGDGLAQVRVRSAAGTEVRTGAAGDFTLAGAGGAIDVRAVGHQPLRVDPLPGARTWTVILSPVDVTELAAVRVTGRAGEGTEEPPEFWVRQARGEGTFITRADIERRRPQLAVHLLESVPGLRLDPDGRVTVNRVASIMDRCEPLYFFDGVRLFTNVADSPLMGLPPSDIAGIEVYRGAAQLPLQFGGSESTCGAIVVWTRRGKWRGR